MRPVNCARDGKGRIFVALDQSPFVLRIDIAGHALQIPAPKGFNTTGPGCVASPNGSVFVASLSPPASSAVIRFRSGSDVPETVILEIEEPFIDVTRHLIHFAFEENSNIMHAITTFLQADSGIAAEDLIQTSWDDSWGAFNPNLTQILQISSSAAAHRIASLSPIRGKRSVAVTQWATDGLVQVFSHSYAEGVDPLVR